MAETLKQLLRGIDSEWLEMSSLPRDKYPFQDHQPVTLGVLVARYGGCAVSRHRYRQAHYYHCHHCHHYCHCYHRYHRHSLSLSQGAAVGRRAGRDLHRLVPVRSRRRPLRPARLSAVVQPAVHSDGCLLPCYLHCHLHLPVAAYRKALSTLQPFLTACRSRMATMLPHYTAYREQLAAEVERAIPTNVVPTSGHTAIRTHTAQLVSDVPGTGLQLPHGSGCVELTAATFEQRVFDSQLDVLVAVLPAITAEGAHTQHVPKLEGQLTRVLLSVARLLRQHAQRSGDGSTAAAMPLICMLQLHWHSQEVDLNWRWMPSWLYAERLREDSPEGCLVLYPAGHKPWTATVRAATGTAAEGDHPFCGVVMDEQCGWPAEQRARQPAHHELLLLLLPAFRWPTVHDVLRFLHSNMMAGRFELASLLAAADESGEQLVSAY